jgi:archaellin
MGNITLNETTNRHEVDYVNLTVMKGFGSGDINLSTTIEWLGPDDGRILTMGDSPGNTQFAVEEIRYEGDSLPVLVSRKDRFRIVLDTQQITGASKSARTSR